MKKIYYFLLVKRVFFDIVMLVQTCGMDDILSLPLRSNARSNGNTLLVI
jgi:hypothetical protein